MPAEWWFMDHVRKLVHHLTRCKEREVALLETDFPVAVDVRRRQNILQFANVEL